MSDILLSVLLLNSMKNPFFLSFIIFPGLILNILCPKDPVFFQHSALIRLGHELKQQKYLLHEFESLLLSLLNFRMK